MRDDDVIGRFGGEEFAAIFLGSANDAAIAAERVRAAFEAAGAIIDGNRIDATVSIGVADGLASACSIEEMLSRADAALYAAKQAGRNRVLCAPEVRPPAEQLAGADFAPAGIPCAA
jgi:diguanylate cyclase (GGDEF)-like protein